MPTLVPVEGNPFAQSAPQQATGPQNLVPVEGNPFAKPADEGYFTRMRKAITGEGKAEFPDAGEFTAGLRGGAYLENREGMPSDIMTSNITSNEAGALDILQKNIPNLQSKKDNKGNLMLKTPGMKDWAYLNKPGLSWRDVDEFMTQTLASLPFLGPAGRGATVAERVGSGAIFGGASEVGREALEQAAGSKQKPSALEPVGAAVITGGLAPGVPSALIKGARDLGSWAIEPIKSYYQRGMAFNAKAEEMLAKALREDLISRLPPEMRQRAMNAQTPEQLSQIAGRRLSDPNIGDMLQEKMGTTGSGSWGAETRLMDIGGENTQDLARLAANRSGTARKILNDVINPRFETQAARAVEFVEGLAGENLRGRSKEALKEMSETARAPFYRRAFRNPTAVHGFTPDFIKNLALRDNEALNQAMAQAGKRMENKAGAGMTQTHKDMPYAMSGPGGHTLEFWDEVKRVFQDWEGGAYRQGHGTQASIWGNWKRQLTDELDAIIPEYKDARQIAKGIFDAEDALEAGEKFVTTRMGNDAAREGMAKMSEIDKEFFRAGYVGRLLDLMKENPDRVSLLRHLAHSPAARERLDIALGTQRASEFRAFVATEHMMDSIRTAVQGNSTTARQWAQMIAGGAATGLTGFDPSNPMTYVTAFLAHRAARDIGLRIDNQFYGELARVMTSRDPAVYQRGLKKLAQPKWLDALLRIDNEMFGNAAVRSQAARAITPQNNQPTQPGMPVR